MLTGLAPRPRRGVIVELAVPLVTRVEKITELNLTFFCVHPTGDKLKTFTTAPLPEIISLRKWPFQPKRMPCYSSSFHSMLFGLFLSRDFDFPGVGMTRSGRSSKNKRKRRKWLKTGGAGASSVRFLSSLSPNRTPDLTLAPFKMISISHMKEIRLPFLFIFFQLALTLDSAVSNPICHAETHSQRPPHSM